MEHPFPDNRACPSEHELSEFVLGKVLDDYLQVEISQHLESCNQCLQTIEVLDSSSDHLVGEIKLPSSQDGCSGTSEKLFKRIFENVKQIANPQKKKRQARLDKLPAIDGYRVIKQIGRGGMGVVYEAEHETLRRRVALKMLPESWGGNDLAVERFFREARAAAQLHHTNIVPVFEIGTCNDTHYYAMQLIDGAPVHDVIRQLKSKSKRSGVQLVDDAKFGTLVQAEDQTIKLANILLDETKPLN